MADGVVDTELSLLGDKPKFGNHGNRRKAEKVACETMDVTADVRLETSTITSEPWEQKERRKKSQLHYQGSTHRNK